MIKYIKHIKLQNYNIKIRKFSFNRIIYSIRSLHEDLSSIYKVSCNSGGGGNNNNSIFIILLVGLYYSYKNR
jgi:hypothetical protein